MQKIVIVESLNVTPEADTEKAIAPLQNQGYRITSAHTSIALQGKHETMGPWGYATAEHVYYVTTVVLEK